MNRWRILPIGELCTAIYDGPHATPKKSSVGPVFLGISNLARGRINLSEVEHLSEEDFVKWTRRVVPSPNDVVFSYETRLGEAAVIPEGLRCCLGRRMALMRPHPSKVDPRFLLYAYLGPEFQATIRARTVHGSTVDRILLTEFPSWPIRVPELSEQRAIAQILGALDDKIELNRRMNETLEAMARALFKSWFVDFDPVRAKAEGRRPSDLDAATAALLPASFEDSPSGKIPKGWRVRPLDQIADFLNGLALQNYPPESDGLPIIKIAELRRGVTESSGRASRDIDPRYVVNDGDVLFSWSGSLEVCIWCGGRGALNQHLFKVTSVEYPKWFFYQWIKEHLPGFQSIAASKATTMGHIQRHHLTAALVVVPPPNILRFIDQKMEALFGRSVANNVESRSLGAVRDGLLPNLLAGEIRVKDAERVVESAT